MKNSQKLARALTLAIVPALIVGLALVPARPAAADGCITHTVKYGETLSGISGGHGVSVGCWGLTNPNQIYSGQQLVCCPSEPPESPPVDPYQAPASPPEPAYQPPAQQSASPAPQYQAPADPNVASADATNPSCSGVCQNGSCWVQTPGAPWWDLFAGAYEPCGEEALAYQAPASPPEPVYQPPAIYQAPASQLVIPAIKWPEVNNKWFMLTDEQTPWYCFPAAIAADIVGSIAGIYITRTPQGFLAGAGAGYVVIQICDQ